MKGGTVMDEPVVAVTCAALRLVECSVCGPVCVTELPAQAAAAEHLGRVHDITTAQRVES